MSRRGRPDDEGTRPPEALRASWSSGGGPGMFPTDPPHSSSSQDAVSFRRDEKARKQKKTSTSFTGGSGSLMLAQRTGLTQVQRKKSRGGTSTKEKKKGTRQYESSGNMYGNRARKSWAAQHDKTLAVHDDRPDWIVSPPLHGHDSIRELDYDNMESDVRMQLHQDEPPPRRNMPEVLPTAMPVQDQQGASRPEQEQSSIPVARLAKWTDAFQNKRKVCIAVVLALLVLGGVIGGVTYAMTSGSSNSNNKNGAGDGSSTNSSSFTTAPATSAPTTSAPTAPSGASPTNAPTSLVFEQLGQTLVNEDEPVDSGPRGVLYFGWAVVLSADASRLVVTAPYHQRVHVYDWDTTSEVWVQTAEIEEDSGLVDHISLSGDGKVLAIGVPRNSDVFENGGKVQVYVETPQGAWEPMGNAIYGEGPGDRIGGFTDDDKFPGDTNYTGTDDDFQQFSRDSYDSSSMALSENGTILAIGSPRGNYVMVFFFDASALQWTTLGTNGDMFAGEQEGDKFGTTVDLSATGHRMVVGAPDNLGTADPDWDIYTGHVRVFQYNVEEDTWIKLGQDIEGDRAAGLAANVPGTKGEQAGSVVSISADGSTIAVGSNFQASSEDIQSLGERDGHIKVYRYAETRDEWIQVGNTINIFQFGLVLRDDWEGVLAVSAGLNSEKVPVVSRLSRDGKRLAVSVLAESLGEEISGRGVVRLYELTGDSWTTIGTPIEGVSEWDHSGRSISLSFDASVIAVGSPQHNANGLDDGQVQVFVLQGVDGVPGQTSPPSTSIPTATPGPLVPITVFLDLDNSPEYLSWTLECGSMLVANVTGGSYNGTEFMETNLTETFYVPEGSICTLSLSSILDLDDYRIVYGPGITSDSPVLVGKTDTPDRSTVSFYVSPDTVALSVFVQLDAYPRETSLGLLCDGFPFVKIPLGDFWWTEPFDVVNLTLAGLKEGAVCEFTIEDAFGDGICCVNGRGYYRINYGGAEGNLLAAGGRFASRESVSFAVSPTEDPVTAFPTSVPPSMPTATPMPTGDFVIITVVIQLSYEPEIVGWSLECDGVMLASIIFGTYVEEYALVMEEFSVRAASTCQFIIATPDGGGLGGDSFYNLFFGRNITNEENLIATGSSFGKRDLVTFTALPPS